MMSGKDFLGYAIVVCIVFGILIDITLHNQVPEFVYIEKNTSVLNELRAEGFDIVPLPGLQIAQGNMESLVSSTFKTKTAFFEEEGIKSTYYYYSGQKWFKLTARNPWPAYNLWGINILSGMDAERYVIINDSTIEYWTAADLNMLAIFSAFMLFVLSLVFVMIGEWLGFLEKEPECCC